MEAEPMWFGRFLHHKERKQIDGDRRVAGLT